MGLAAQRSADAGARVETEWGSQVELHIRTPGLTQGYSLFGKSHDVEPEAASANSASAVLALAISAACACVLRPVVLFVFASHGHQGAAVERSTPPTGSRVGSAFGLKTIQTTAYKEDKSESAVPEVEGESRKLKPAVLKYNVGLTVPVTLRTMPETRLSSSTP